MKGYERLKELLSLRTYSPKKPNELYESDFSDLSLDEFADALQRAIDEGLAVYGKKGKLLSAENADGSLVVCGPTGPVAPGAQVK